MVAEVKDATPRIEMSESIVRLMQSRDQEVLVEGGARCCGGEVELWNPMKGKGERFDILEARGAQVWVQTLNGPILADAPFKKGISDLYRVTLEDGSSTVVTNGHRFLTPSGWVALAALGPSSVVLGGLGQGKGHQSSLPASALHSTQRRASCQGRCSPCCRQCDRQPLCASASSQASPPLRGGVHGNSRADSPADALGSRRARSHSCQSFARLSRRGGSALAAESRAGSDQTAGCECRLLGSSCQVFGPSQPSRRPLHTSLRSRKTGDGIRLRDPSIGENRPFAKCDEPCRNCGQSPQRLESCASGENTGPRSLAAALESDAYSSLLQYRAHPMTVKSIAFLRRDIFYDLHVPGEEHYLADGVYSHNTGKSFGLCTYARLLCERYPGCKILFVRQTRKSLNHSILSLWEEILGRDHSALQPRKMRRARDEYIFPYNETKVDGVLYKGVSEVHLIGMDNPERLMSTEYDVIMVFEATELSLRSWALAFSRLSNHHMPYQVQVADCNPAAETHWLNLRAEEPLLDGDVDTGRKRMNRICTRLEDNPKFWDAERGKWKPAGKAYNMILDNLPPLERGRLRDGLWISATGQVFPNWRPSTHIVQGKLVSLGTKDDKRWRLEPVNVPGVTPDFTARDVAWFGVSVDWGFLPDPGAAALYAVDDHGRSFVVCEDYTTSKPLEWWAKRIVTWQKRYDVRVIITDVPAEKCATLNDMLGRKLGFDGRPIARVTKKGPGSVKAGIDILRQALEPDNDGEPTLRYLATAPRLVDQYLVENLLPTHGAAEYPGYVYPERADGKPNKDEPMDLNNHGIDRDRYWVTYLWGTSPAKKKVEGPVETPLYINVASDVAKIEQDNIRRQRRR